MFSILFSPHVLLEAFLPGKCLVSYAEDRVTNVGLHMKSLKLCVLNENKELDNFTYNSLIQDFVKIYPTELKLFHACRKTKGQTM
jgi:hypothetical protein